MVEKTGGVELRCRPMQRGDLGLADRAHWKSADQVADYIERQRIASMLAFDGERCVGQLYLQAYDPAFRERADGPATDPGPTSRSRSRSVSKGAS